MDGEFNSLRTNGLRRPISIIEVAKKAKKTAKSMKAAVVSKCFELDNQEDNQLQAFSQTNLHSMHMNRKDCSHLIHHSNSNIVQ